MKKKPCEWCEGEGQQTFSQKNAEVCVEVYPDNCLIGITVFGKSDDGDMTGEEYLTIPMFYCPNCGRKLG